MANHKNFAQTTLAAAITTTNETSITVTSETSFPAVDFIISIDTEAMLVTNVAGTTWTVTRGYEGSTAATHLNGAVIYHDWSAGEADSTVHGPASATDNAIVRFDAATGKLTQDTPAMVVGDDANITLSSVVTDDTVKTGRFFVGHYHNEEKPIYMFGAGGLDTTATVAIGGGHSSYNAATQIDLHTAANNTTLAGAPRLTVYSTGNVGIGTNASAGGYPAQSLLDVQGPAGAPGLLTLSTQETTVVDGDILGQINFNAPKEADGGDALLAGASIKAIAEGTFNATNNATELVFSTGASEEATQKMVISSGGNVGINAESPSSKLHVRQAAANNALLFETYSDTASHNTQITFNHSFSDTLGTLATTTDTCNLGTFLFQGVNANGTPAISLGAALKAQQIGAAGSGANTVPAALIFMTANAAGFAERMRVTPVGNVSIGGTADRASTIGTNALNIFDGTAPVGTLANGCSIYSTSGELRTMDAAGNATLQTPHDDENYWVFDSKNTVTGKHLKIDVEKLLRALNDKFGFDFVHDLLEEP